jgi:hypothetical protein
VGVFPDGAIVVAIRLEGVVGPKKSLNDSSQGGGDVWYPLESGHQGDGIGVLGMSAYTTERPFTPHSGRISDRFEGPLSGPCVPTAVIYIELAKSTLLAS